MKLKFWKKTNNGQGKGKCSRKSSDRVECESLRTALEELRSYVDKITQQQQRIEQLFDTINQTVYEIDQTIAIHEQVKEEAKRAEEWQKERLIRAICQMKQEHHKKVEKLQNEKNEVESSFQSYKLNAEKAEKEKEEELQKLKTEIHELQQKNKVLEEKISLPCQANQSKYEPPLSEATALAIKKPMAVLPPLQSRRNIQAPQRIGGLNFNPLTSAFHVYNKAHCDFVKPASLSPEDAEVAAILSNVAQPGEYVRQDYYGYY